MAHRVLHCGNSLDNYYKCVQENVAGFKKMKPPMGDVVYLAVKVGPASLCGVRGILGEIAANKPWKDASQYHFVRSITELEYCEPFDLSVLRSIGGRYWAAKYLQGSKAINDRRVTKLLHQAFNARKRRKLFRFS